MSGKGDPVFLVSTLFCVLCVVVCCGFYIRLEFKLQAFEKRISAVERRNPCDKTDILAQDLASERKGLHSSPLSENRIRRSDESIGDYTKADLIKEIVETVYSGINKYCVTRGPEATMCLKGSQGPSGVTGSQGPKGTPGAAGRPGMKGQKGDKCEECSVPVAHVTTRSPAMIGNSIHRAGIFVSPSTLTIGENATARFTCNGGMNSNKAQASWSRLLGKTFPAGRTTAGKDGILRITSVHVDDAGVYICSVVSESGVVTQAEVKLTVHAPPRISLDPGPTYVELGRNVTLPICHVIGFPSPVVTWAKVFDRLPVGRLVVATRTLTILDANKADSGSYICKATSSAGSSRQTTQLVVVMVPRFTHRPRSVTEKFAGSSITIQCQATGDPVPSISWENACAGKLPETRMETTNGSLTISDLETKDSGRYFCKATSGFLQVRAAFELRIKTARDCSMLYSAGIRDDGVFSVDPDDRGPFAVFCDMRTDGGGWTVFQRRRDGSVNFFLDWDAYKTGFGDLNGEFWLGNEKIYRLTKSASVLRVDLEDRKGNKTFAKYGRFRLGNESTKYRLTAASFTGTAANSLSYHNGMPFTTRDNDNDRRRDNCAVVHVGAWWYDNCVDSNLNGMYGVTNNKDPSRMTWDYWKNSDMALKATELKLKVKEN